MPPTSASPRPPRPHHPIRGTIAALLILAVGVSATLTVASLWSGLADRDRDVEIRAAVDTVERRVRDAVEHQERLIDALGHELSADPPDDAAEFAALTARFDLADYPGVIAVSWVKPVRNEDVDAFVTATRSRGVPTFGVFDLDEDTDRHHIVQFVEPQDVTTTGRDLVSDDLSRRPLLEALDAGRVVVGPREPVPPTGRFGGARDSGGVYRLYLPVRARLGNRPTIDDDGVELVGTLRMTVLGDWFLEPLVEDSAVEVELYESEVAPGRLLGASTSPAERREEPVGATRTIDFLGADWVIVPRVIGEVSTGAPIDGPLMVVLVGLAASLCLFGFVWSLHRGRRRALRLVEETTHSLQVSEARFRSVVQHAFDLVWIEDDEGRPIYVSPSVTHMLGWSAEEVLEGGLASIIPDEDQERTARERAARRATPGAGPPFELRLSHRDGTWRDVVAVSTNLLDEPDVAGVVYNAHDITERKAAEVKLEYQASHDPLTGLPNRAILLDALERALARDDREPGRRTAVLFMDLDGFKVVNDSLGHDAGDDLLGAVARRVRDTIRPQDVVARFGGDEFVIVCDPVESLVEAEQIATRVREAVGQPSVLGGVEVRVSGSIGIALSTVGVAAEKLLRDADAAMYRAKDRGRNRHEVHADPLERRRGPPEPRP